MVPAEEYAASRGGIMFWRPDASCTDACLADPVPPAGRARRLLRYLAAATVVVPAFGLLLVQRLCGHRGSVLWPRVLARALGVRLEVPPPPATAAGGLLVVANHISWLDVLVLMACRPGPMVAKEEVTSYPVVGALSSRAGTIAIDRDRPMSLPSVVAEAARRLRAGSTVVAFPEATTWCGRDRGVFRPAFFQAAIDAGVPVQPVAIRYRLSTGPATTRPAFVGEGTLLTSLRRVVAMRGLVAEAVALPVIAPESGHDRRALAELSYAAITGVLRNP